MSQTEFFIVSSLEKVFPTVRPMELNQSSFKAVGGDTISFQLIFHMDFADQNCRQHYYDVSVRSKLEGTILRDTELVPAQYLATENRDRYYISTSPGLYPDLLLPSNGRLKPLPDQYRSLWITIPIKEGLIGTYDYTLKAEGLIINSDTNEEKYVSGEVWEKTLSITVLDESLPKQQLLHTEWFHVDCLCNFYNVKAWSDEHWRIIKNFISYAKSGCSVNTLLTPVFTPPLDTDIGGERTTVQLVTIFKKDSQYVFDFSKLRTWCEICKEEGIESLEIAHFFTQWGAHKTPKIMVWEDGVEIMKFGWHVSATNPEYRNFLLAFVPALINELLSAGYDRDHLYFHISDEPNETNMDSYVAAKGQIADLLEGYVIMDALSNFEFYKKGHVAVPVTSNDRIDDFHGTVENLWTYYCIAQGNLVPNRFLGMTSSRNRIMGVLFYLYNVTGFLHWGYNYYNDENSRNPVNPYVTTDGNKAFPAGDPFLVYPGPDGKPYSSIRNEVQKEAFLDLRYLKLLEEKIGRDAVIKIITNGTSPTFTFTEYPRSSQYLIDLRIRILETLSA